MAIQFSTAIRNAQANAIESNIGTSATLEIRTGAPPANCAASDTGSVLTTINLPSDLLSAASSGAVTIAGTWTATATGSGTAGHFRIKASGGTAHMQGTVSQQTASGGTGDLRLALESATITAGNIVTVDAFTITMGGA